MLIGTYRRISERVITGSYGKSDRIQGSGKPGRIKYAIFRNHEDNERLIIDRLDNAVRG